MDGGSKAGPGGPFRRQMNPWGMGMARGGFPSLQARQAAGPDITGGRIAQGSPPGLEALLLQIASQSMASEGRQQPARDWPTQQTAPIGQAPMPGLGSSQPNYFTQPMLSNPNTYNPLRPGNVNPNLLPQGLQSLMQAYGASGQAVFPGQPGAMGLGLASPSNPFVTPPIPAGLNLRGQQQYRPQQAPGIPVATAQQQAQQAQQQLQRLQMIKQQPQLEAAREQQQFQQMQFNGQQMQQQLQAQIAQQQMAQAQKAYGQQMQFNQPLQQQGDLTRAQDLVRIGNAFYHPNALIQHQGDLTRAQDLVQMGNALRQGSMTQLGQQPMPAQSVGLEASLEAARLQQPVSGISLQGSLEAARLEQQLSEAMRQRDMAQIQQLLESLARLGQ